MSREIAWTPNQTHPDTIEAFIDGVMYAWITKRPAYCDRGHWSAHVIGIRDIDGQDGFPRYYMRLETAMNEMTEFLKWRLWREDIA